MQIMTDQDKCTFDIAPNFIMSFVKGRWSGLVQILSGFARQHQLRTLWQGAGLKAR